MRKTSNDYIEYLKEKKNISPNTEKSYRNDLNKMIDYFNLYKILDYKYINSTNLNSYILHMEIEAYSSPTIARNIAVIKGYFDYLFRMRHMEYCITEDIRRPVVEVKVRKSADSKEVRKLMESVGGQAVKDLRDYAIMQLMVHAKIPVSELIELSIDDLNFDLNYIQSQTRKKLKSYSLDQEVMDILCRYIEQGRSSIIREEEVKILFPNMRGTKMSRQGVWKMVKAHAKIAGVEDLNLARLCKVDEM